MSNTEHKKSCQLQEELAKAINLHRSFEKTKKILDEISSENLLQDLKLSQKIQPDSSPIAMAVRNDASDILRLLLNHGANVNAYVLWSSMTTSMSMSLIHLAIKEKKIKCFELLLDQGADPNLPGILKDENVSETSKTPFQYATTLLSKAMTQADKDVYKKMIELISEKLKEGQVQQVRIWQRPLPPAPTYPPPSPPTSASRNLSTFQRESPLRTRLSNLQQRATPVQDTASPVPSVTPLFSAADLPALQKKLEKALDLQEERKNLENDLKKVEKDHLQEVKRYRIKKNHLEKKMKDIESNPEYKDVDAIQVLTNDITNLMQQEESKKQTVVTEAVGKTVDNNSGVTCPVCFENPNEIYCCQICDNMICGDCKRKINSCPICREDFRKKPPQRNKFAERLLKQ